MEFSIVFEWEKWGVLVLFLSPGLGSFTLGLGRYTVQMTSDKSIKCWAENGPELTCHEPSVDCQGLLVHWIVSQQFFEGVLSHYHPLSPYVVGLSLHTIPKCLYVYMFVFFPALFKMEAALHLILRIKMENMRLFPLAWVTGETYWCCKIHKSRSFLWLVSPPMRLYPPWSIVIIKVMCYL